MAWQPTRARELCEAVCDSGRRRGQLARIGGDVVHASTDFAARRASRSEGTRIESTRPRTERRSGNGSDRGRAGKDTVVPQRRSEDAGDQLQGATLQNAAIQPGYASQQEIRGDSGNGSHTHRGGAKRLTKVRAKSSFTSHCWKRSFVQQMLRGIVCGTLGTDYGSPQADSGSKGSSGMNRMFRA